MSLTDYQVNISAGAAKLGKNSYQRFFKRAKDLSLILLIAPIALPLIAAVYAATRRDGGPGFFGHKRVGKDGREFRCWKIRTMVPNAEAALTDYLASNPEAAAEWARDFKLTNDPRVTPLGDFLRRSSLDELPQIWNVLRGEMSFVGPRPVTRTEIAKYQGYEWCYFSVKPGITGLWQVSGRNDVDYATRVQLDVDYAQSVRFGRDAQIILKTAGAVLNRTGR